MTVLLFPDAKRTRKPRKAPMPQPGRLTVVEAQTPLLTAPASIYRMTREWSTYMWLCDRHVAARRADNWGAEVTEAKAQGCDDCRHEAGL